jgi:hypothetical protein
MQKDRGAARIMDSTYSADIISSAKNFDYFDKILKPPHDIKDLLESGEIGRVKEI